jgi:DNA-binding transcriptional LysR family regulator
MRPTTLDAAAARRPRAARHQRRSVLGLRCSPALLPAAARHPQPQQQAPLPQLHWWLPRADPAGPQPAPGARRAAAGATLLAALGLGVGITLAPASAAPARAFTTDESLTISVFKKATPSVVNVTNLTAR